MTRLAAFAAAVVLLVVAAAVPAAASQTEQFGIAAAQSERLEVTVEAGRTSQTAVRVWNRTDAPLTVGLDVYPATVTDAGATLQGSREPVGWVELAARQVTLPPNGSRDVGVEVTGPDMLEQGEHTVAIVAQVLPVPGVAAQVVERLAPILYLHAEPGTAPAQGLGPIPWFAGLLAAAAAGATAARAKRDQDLRNQSTVARSPSSSDTGSMVGNS